MTIATRGRNEWLVPSQSSVDVVYLVKRVAGALSCDCNGFYYRGHCCHADAVQAMLPKPVSAGPSVEHTRDIFLAHRTPR